MYHIRRVIRLLFAVAVAIPAGLSLSSAADPTPKLVTEHFTIEAADPGMKLYVRNKRPEAMTQFTAEKTLLFVHGATQPAEATFDLPLEGVSWMDYIASRGWDVYLVDVRGVNPSAGNGSAGCEQFSGRYNRCGHQRRQIRDRLHPPAAKCVEDQSPGLVLGDRDHGRVCSRPSGQGRTACTLWPNMVAHLTGAAGSEPFARRVHRDANGESTGTPASWCAGG
jgi:pimeloyl-ACP methyl ester carboxylesterase